MLTVLKVLGLFKLLLVIFKEADRKPVSTGANAILNVHVLPEVGGITPTAQVDPEIVKSPGFVPTREIFEIVNGPFPVLVRVTVWAALVVVTGCGLENDTNVGDSEIFGVRTPFPVKVTFWVGPTLGTNDKLAVFGPVVEGVKVIENAQVPPDPSTFALVRQVVAALLEITNSLEFAPVRFPPLVIVIWLAPPLIRNTARGALVCPTVWFPKSSVVVERLITGGSPTPLKETLRGLPGPSSVNTNVAVAVPVAVGAKTTSATHEVPALTVPPFTHVELDARM
jgi:hypothetical protein